MRNLFDCGWRVNNLTVLSLRQQFRSSSNVLSVACDCVRPTIRRCLMFAVSRHRIFACGTISTSPRRHSQHCGHLNSWNSRKMTANLITVHFDSTPFPGNLRSADLGFAANAKYSNYKAARNFIGNPAKSNANFQLANISKLIFLDFKLESLCKWGPNRLIHEDLVTRWCMSSSISTYAIKSKLDRTTFTWMKSSFRFLRFIVQIQCPPIRA